MRDFPGKTLWWARGRGALQVAVLWLALVASASAAPLLYVVRENDPELRVVDGADASTLVTRTVSLSGETVFGSSGLARNPLDGQLYALLWLDGQVGRELVTLDGNTGDVLTRIGDTGDFFTALAFDDSGTLYGLTHDDATAPSELHTLSLVDATPTFVAALGDDGGFGEALSWNPGDGLLYRASGEPGGQLLESIDPDTLVRTAIATSGDAYDEALGLTHSGPDSFYMADFLGGPGSGGVSDLYLLGADGVVTRIGHLGFSDARGLAIVPEPGTLFLLGTGLGWLALRRRVSR